jgi:sporadic carbohydrate cluster protein (TIGR04323 family)
VTGEKHVYYAGTHFYSGMRYSHRLQGAVLHAYGAGLGFPELLPVFEFGVADLFVLLKKLANDTELKTLICFSAEQFNLDDLKHVEILKQFLEAKIVIHFALERIMITEICEIYEIKNKCKIIRDAASNERLIRQSLIKWSQVDG